MTAVSLPGMVALTDVAAAVAWLRQKGVRHLQCDSRRVQPGDAFVAWPGFATDGRHYVPAALRAGALACVVEADGLPAALAGGLWANDAQQGTSVAQANEPIVASLTHLKAVTGQLAAAFYGNPSRQLKVVAVTGTNGKTSTTWWLAQALAALHKPCGVMGTLGVGVPGTGSQALDSLEATGLTTPDPVLCQATLRRWADQGVWACAAEASSIGIAEHRLAGTEMAVAVFTNFTQDHLDYHGSMAAYWQAKR
ncbi:MAG: UDP-N-acetylmuramoyl-L-alanyl-D-glutamate--2,6-diaminopimelate ligase, partial [Burkholderiales bacterium]|nr:UDP-N-acetylmuramoyl-L-alanyl-D-glutamate--2,6-diaminopimelate ligase [Burkholderiales bacterium]